MSLPKEVTELGNTSKRFYFITEAVALFTLLCLKNTLSSFQILRLLIEALLAGYFYLSCTDSSGSILPVDDIELHRVSMSSIHGEPEQEDQNIQPEVVPQVPERNYCNICKHFQPYRAKHCTKCNKCIPKYDHHCFWIGGCVGELNHRVFWGFICF